MNVLSTVWLLLLLLLVATATHGRAFRPPHSPARACGSANQDMSEDFIKGFMHLKAQMMQHDNTCASPGNPKKVKTNSLKPLMSQLMPVNTAPEPESADACTRLTTVSPLKCLPPSPPDVTALETDRRSRSLQQDFEAMNTLSEELLGTLTAVRRAYDPLEVLSSSVKRKRNKDNCVREISTAATATGATADVPRIQKSIMKKQLALMDNKAKQQDPLVDPEEYDMDYDYIDY